jgi:TolB protein
MNHKVSMLLCAVWLMVATPAHGILEIEITQGIEGALPIAIVPFTAVATESQPPEAIDAIVAADLRRSGLFAPVPDDSFPQQPRAAEDINYPMWRNQGIENIVMGSIESTGPNHYVVRFQLFDAIRGRSLMGYSIPAARQSLRKVAHKISDLIYEKLIGQRGAFSSRIVYVSAQRSTKEKNRFVLQVADSDGYNPQTIYSSSRPLMSPAWSPDGQRVAYVSFEGRKPEVFVQSLQTGTREKVSGRPGINSAPAWSPDGRRIALTLSVDGNPDVYVMNVITGALKRLTRDSAIDTEPVWMPDGRALIFTSDRSGQPQLYQVSATGGRATRLTFEGKYNAAADISPDGDKVAMVHGGGDGYRIAVMDLSNKSLRVLTDGTLDESPSFAPNGGMIIYATEKRGRGVLAAVSVDGQFHQRLSLQSGDVREPVWEPFSD